MPPGRPIALVLAASIASGYVLGCSGDGQPQLGEEPHEAAIPEGAAAVKIFADKAWYLERKEADENLRGILRESPVREGPNTRDMPFELVVGEEKLSVYVSGIDAGILEPFVNREVEIIGKRIDQRAEGFGIEVWIASIATVEE